MAEPLHYIMRHGTTDANKDKKKSRTLLDEPLDDKGILDARKGAEFLRDKDIQRIIVTPHLRGVQTGEICAGTFGGRYIEQNRGLFAWENPLLFGLDMGEYDRVVKQCLAHPDEEIEGGENLDQFTKRVGDFFEKELRSQATTLFVTSSSATIIINCLCLGLDPPDDIMPEPGGILAVYEDKDGYRLEPAFGKTKPAKFGG